MVMPGIFRISCLIYFSGFRDEFIDPLLPTNTPSISTGGSTRTGPNGSDFFLALTDYRASEEERQEIAEWVANESLLGTFDD